MVDMALLSVGVDVAAGRLRAQIHREFPFGFAGNARIAARRRAPHSLGVTLFAGVPTKDAAMRHHDAATRDAI
jgi:hypothetical protein